MNETLARRLTPGGSPVGRNVKFDVPVFNGQDGTRVWSVVGVSTDTWDRGPREAVEPEVLIPLAQTPAEVFSWISRELQLVVRTRGTRRHSDPRCDAWWPQGTQQSRSDRRAGSRTSWPIRSRASASWRLCWQGLGFAGVGLSLLGLFAVVNHHVQRRRRDIAIRVALGAPSPAVVRALVRDGAKLAAMGGLAGVGMSIGTGGLLSSLLFGVAPGDPVTLVTVAALVVVMAALAAWLPARSPAAWTRQRRSARIGCANETRLNHKETTLAPDATQDATREVVEALGRLLATSYTLYLKTHNYHWNVTGPMFTTLHTMFETQYTRAGPRRR